ncbi:MAG: Emopamil binding protein-domain-containing protein [Benniella sp.]|nr:MAG: Emopamil binding protein-domain-containing protein [Benniella sp.]
MASPVAAESIPAVGRVAHPYYPRNLVLDHYVPNSNTMQDTLVVLFSCFGSIALGAVVLSYQRRNSTIKGLANQLTFLWFFMCGFIHLFLEGYFGIYHKTLAGDQFFLAQIWKEYSLSDSRYLSSDPFVLIMERLTAFAWGPLAFYIAYAMYYNRPTRHVVQLIVSVGQLYGTILYYLTTMIEGSPHCDPHPYYVYFYFGFFNFFWMIVPMILIVQSSKNLHTAMKLVQQKHKKLQ